LILTFGSFRGCKLSDKAIPDSYIRWLALRGSYTMPGNRFETKWKVPIVVSIEARREMENRGYKRVGDWYTKEED
jgi:hypothetical protein